MQPLPTTVPTLPAFPKLEFGPPIESRLTPELRTKRLQLVLSIFKSIKERGINLTDPYNLDKQRVTELIKTRDRELAAQGLSWNMDFNFFIRLLDRNHPVATVFLAQYAHDIFDSLDQIHRTDPTMSPPKSTEKPIDIIAGNVQQILRGRLSPDEIKGFEQLAKKVLGVNQK